MKLTQNLVLFKFLLQQVGFDSFQELKEKFSSVQAGYDTTGHSYYANTLLALKHKIPSRELLHYDDIIRNYEQTLSANRAEPYLSFKYFQYFALLFTEYYLNRYTSDKENLFHELNSFKNNRHEFAEIDDFSESDLKKLAYWMATGSGKTLIMHVNFWQLTKYFQDWENIILITPNEGLSRQHYKEFRRSGINAKLYTGSEDSLKTRENEVLIIEITKLVKEKEGEGVSVDVDYFSESRNLVFIDEGHKGQRSEEKAWKQLREYLTRGEGSFSVEYSATFGQIIGNRDRDLLNEYGKAIIFDYSYRHFYSDGYGKDFSVFNINTETDYTVEDLRLLLTGNLLTFYEQLILYKKHRNELAKYNIEKPLWIFVGSKVVGKKSSLTEGEKRSVSDVAIVLEYFKSILSNPSDLEGMIKKLLQGNSGLFDERGDDIFKYHFSYLRTNPPSVTDIFDKIFGGSGELEAWQIKQADGEIGLKTSLASHYFGVINIGDVPSFSKKLIEDFGNHFEIRDDNFHNSLFHSLSDLNSPLNILIGSKKFIEGWNSWRVSSMGLMNMGKNEGTQIIQLFGRGVRLKGRNFSLKREEESAPYFLRSLQTISIFGLNAEYMNNFLTAIEKEVQQYYEFNIPIKFNQEEKWNKKIVTLKKPDAAIFKEVPIQLQVNQNILNRIQIDLRPKISVARSSVGFVAEHSDEFIDSGNILQKFKSFIDFEKLFLDAFRYKTIRGYVNLLLERNVIEEIIDSNSYKIIVLPNQVNIEDALNGRVQQLAFDFVKDYIDKFYSDKEKEFVTKHLTYDLLDRHGNTELFPGENKIVIRVPQDRINSLKQIIDDFNRFYVEDVDEIPTIHFDKHLYSPLAVYGKGKEEIKTVPVKLNEGETKFIRHLREYFIILQDKIRDKEIFILRNLSRSGLGFFIESSSFFPDFIIWVVGPKRQDIIFIDPKGILMLGNFGHEKVVFCNKTIKEIELAALKKLKENNESLSVGLKAFILSLSEFKDIQDIWGRGENKIADFRKNNILFLDNRKDYLNDIFGDILFPKCNSNR